MYIPSYKGYSLYQYQLSYQNPAAAVNSQGYYPAESTAAAPNREVEKPGSAGKTGAVECQTCRERKYRDISNDAGVSFKAPGHIPPGISASTVRSHEFEHVRNEYAKAARQDRKIVSQSVSLKTGVCPECGRVYISGGETRTVTKNDDINRNDDPSVTVNALKYGRSQGKIDMRI